MDLEAVCSTCGRKIRAGARVCFRCDAAQTPEAAAPGGCFKALARLFGLQPAPTPAFELTPAFEPTPAEPKTASTAEQLPYRLNHKFLTPAEASFFRVLQHALPDGVLLCPKVNLRDLFWAPQHDYTARNRIDRKHVDFVLADVQTLRPVCGIELDDRSHQRPDRQQRDRFVEAVFATAGLPLVRVPVRASYDVAALAAQLSSALVPAPAGEADPLEPAASAAPTCPKCRTEMVLRTTRRGANAGQTFYGCPNYPQCTGIA